MKKSSIIAILGAVIILTGVNLAHAEHQAPQNLKISDIMTKIMKGGRNSLVRKVTDAKATKAEYILVGQYLEALGQHKTPPKGTAEGWLKKIAPLVQAGKLIQQGKPAGVILLKKNADCKGCHKLYKPED